MTSAAEQDALLQSPDSRESGAGLTFAQARNISFPSCAAGTLIFPVNFSDLRLIWNVDEVFGLKPRHTIAPTQEAPVVVQAAGSEPSSCFAGD